MAVGGIGGVSPSGAASLVGRLYQQQAAEIAGSVASPGGTAGVETAAQARGADFASAVGDGLRTLESLDRTASTRAVQAATGDLTDIHDYVIAATSMQTATELTTTVRNKALEAFSEIMRMPL